MMDNLYKVRNSVPILCYEEIERNISFSYLLLYWNSCKIAPKTLLTMPIQGIGSLQSSGRRSVSQLDDSRYFSAGEYINGCFFVVTFCNIPPLLWLQPR